MHFDQNSDVSDWYMDTWCTTQVLIIYLFSMEEITWKKINGNVFGRTFV